MCRGDEGQRQRSWNHMGTGEKWRLFIPTCYTHSRLNEPLHYCNPVEPFIYHCESTVSICYFCINSVSNDMWQFLVFCPPSPVRCIYLFLLFFVPAWFATILSHRSCTFCANQYLFPACQISDVPIVLFHILLDFWGTCLWCYPTFCCSNLDVLIYLFWGVQSKTGSKYKMI